MVLYKQNGRVIAAHEAHLEEQAGKIANDRGYMDQIEIFEQKSQQASRTDVQFVIDSQKFMTLFCHNNDGWGSDYEKIKAFGADTTTIEKRVDRDTLIKCSSLARDHFSYNPGDDELHLLVRHPRVHISGPTSTRREFEAAYEGRLIQTGKRIVR